MNETAVNWFPEEREAIRPPEEILISQWMGENIVLGQHSAIKGPYNLDMVPILKSVIDACQDWDTDEVVFCKPAQYGGTTGLLGVITYFAAEESAPVMVVLADQLTSQYINTKRLKGIFRDSSTLKHLYDPNEFSRNEISLPNGGYITLAWASSIAMLATRDIRIVYGDEIDKPGYNVTTEEADALSLMRERTESYPEGYYKHIFSSTPTTEDGNITKEMNTCDIIYDRHVPCPHCGHMQPLRWSAKYMFGFEDGMYRAEDGVMHKIGGVVWDGGREATKEQIRETARYACGECGVLWSTQEKNEAVSAGREVGRTEPTGCDRKKGYHANRIYSLFDGGNLDKLVQRWVDIFKFSGIKRHKKLQGFINSTLAEPYKQIVVSSSKLTILKARCELLPQTVPVDAVALTAGVDVQKHGFWFAVRAWARDYISWLIHYGFLGTWEEVEQLLFESQYPIVESDTSMRIWRAAVDTGGGVAESGLSMTEETYWWLRKNGTGRGCRVWGTKGSSRPLAGKIHMGKPLDKTPSGKAIPGGLQIILLDTNDLKDMVTYRLGQAVEQGPMAAYLHAKTDDRYARQILAEQKQRSAKGVEEWVQVGTDNHLFDCEVMCQAVAEPEWPGGGVNLIRSPLRIVDGIGDGGKRGNGEKAKAVKPPGGNWQQRGAFKRPGWLNR